MDDAYLLEYRTNREKSYKISIFYYPDVKINLTLLINDVKL